MACKSAGMPSHVGLLRRNQAARPTKPRNRRPRTTLVRRGVGGSAARNARPGAAPRGGGGGERGAIGHSVPHIRVARIGPRPFSVGSTNHGRRPTARIPSSDQPPRGGLGSSRRPRGTNEGVGATHAGGLSTLSKASVSFVITHICLIAKLVYKALVLITETVINSRKHTLFRGHYEGIQAHQRPRGVSTARGRDPTAGHLSPSSEGDDREPDRGGTEPDAAGDLPSHPQVAGCGHGRGRPRRVRGPFHRNVLSCDGGDLQHVARQRILERLSRGDGR